MPDINKYVVTHASTACFIQNSTVAPLTLTGFFKGSNGAYAPNQGGNQSKFVVLGFRPIAGIFLRFHDT